MSLTDLKQLFALSHDVFFKATKKLLVHNGQKRNILAKSNSTYSTMHFYLYIYSYGIVKKLILG